MRIPNVTGFAACSVPGISLSSMIFLSSAQKITLMVKSFVCKKQYADLMETERLLLLHICFEISALYLKMRPYETILNS